MNAYYILKKIPDLLSDLEKKRFKENNYLKLFTPGIKRLHHVWVTYSGICFTPFKIYRRSVYYKAYPLFQYYLQGAFNLLTRKKRILQSRAFFIHTPWSVVNYHHWLVDSLPRLHQIKKISAPQDILILPEVLKDVPFVQDSLKMAGKFDLQYFSPDEVLKIPETVLVEISPGKYFLSDALKQTVQSLKESLDEKVPYRRIFLTRRNVGYRMLTNEKETCDLLANYGFRIVEADKLTFKEQIELFHETSVVVAIHGAALTNCIFMQENTTVVELHPDISDKKTIFNVCYYDLSAYFNLQYYFLGCEPVNTQEKFHTANLTADLKKLEKILEISTANRL